MKALDLNAVFIGLVAALIAWLPGMLRVFLPEFPWFSPVLVAGVCALGVVLLRRGTVYAGISDYFSFIHYPNNKEGSAKWGCRALMSFLFTCIGVPLGVEGAVAEAGLALAVSKQSRWSPWTEQFRRTQAGAVLAAALSAAFLTPFAAVLFVLESSIGGRLLSSVIAALSAWGVSRILPAYGGKIDLVGAVYEFEFNEWRQWFGMVTMGVAGGLFSAFLIRLSLWVRESLSLVAKGRTEVRLALAGLFLVLIAWVYVPGHLPITKLFEECLWGHRSMLGATLTLVVMTLSWITVYSSFGTLGGFWPILTIGSYLGFLGTHLWFEKVPAFQGAGAMIGAAAFFSAFFGTPIAAAVLVWEMTQNPYLLFPAWIAAMIAIEVRKRLGRDSFNEEDMRRRGLTIQGGRRLQILEKLKVGDAMVRDFQAVMDTESIADLHSRILAARYPYLPVINAAGAYLGLITVDSIQDAWQAHDPQAAHIPLAHLLEAKDLLYRTTVKPPLIKEDDRMAKVISLLEAFPCLPVLGPQKQVIGLLLGHHVRLAYESESARSLLIPQHLKI